MTIPVDEAVANVLAADPRNRATVGRLVSHILFPKEGPSELALLIAEIKADARAAGLTDEDVDAELAAYNAERREARPDD